MRRRSCRAERILLRVEHHAADQAFGDLVAHGPDAGITLTFPGEAHHDGLADHPIEEIVRLCRLLQRGEAIRLCGAERGAEREVPPPPAARNQAESIVPSWSPASLAFPFRRVSPAFADLS